ncbi:MAG: FGGY family carbohydrate kinase [Limnochordia bacterium]
MKYLIGLDVGTSAVKALLVTGEGAIVGSFTVEYPFFSPQPGWIEQNPEDMWRASAEAVRGVLDKYSVSPEDVAGLGLSGQMHSSVFLDEKYEVIRPAILWNDVRTTAQCRSIEAAVGMEVLQEEVCNPVLEGFTLPKVVWLKENEPENYAKLSWLVLPKDYVRFRLTGNVAMEVSDAAGMLMMNVRQRVWSRPILDSLDISPDILPPIVGSSEVAGTITAEAAEATGLTPGTPCCGRRSGQRLRGGWLRCSGCWTGYGELGHQRSGLGPSGQTQGSHRGDSAHV